jgi:hypothetical protein
MRGLPLILLVAACWAFVAEARAARVAILPAPGLEDAAAVLTAALSTTPGVEVVERERLDAIVREENLQVLSLSPGEIAALGRLVNAEALLILDQPSKGRDFSCRLVATDASIVIANDRAIWPMEEPSDWANLQARRLALAMSALPKKPGVANLVALLGVRSPTAGFESRKLARDTAFVISSALSGIPGVFSLERERMREADWEKQLSESASGQFWSGAWLLDGNIQETGRGLRFDGQLKPLGAGTAQAISVQAADIDAIGKSVADAVAKITKSSPHVVGGASAEARFFQDQAEWAFRWELYDEAERAADASWLLGNKNEAVGSIRVLAPIRALGTQFSQQMDGLGRGVSNFRELSRSAGELPSAKFLADATELVSIASAFLKARYFLRSERSPEESEQLQWLRGQLRAITPAISKACQRAWENLDAIQRSNAGFPTAPPGKFFVEYLIYAPLWGDTLEQSAEEFEKALATSDQLDPVLGQGVRRMALLDRENSQPTLPIVAAWNVSDRPRVPEVRNRLLEKMRKGTPNRKLEASYLSLLRYYHFSDAALREKVPDAVLEKEFQGLFKTLNEMSSQIAAGQVAANPLSEVLILSGQIAETYERPGLAALAQDLQKKFLLRMLRARWPGPPEVYNPLLRALVFTNAERDQFVAAIRAVPGTWNGKHLAETIAKQTNVDALYVPGPPPMRVAENALAPTFRFNIERASERTQMEHVQVVDGRYLVESRESPAGLAIVELDPQTGKQRAVFDAGMISDPAVFSAIYGSQDWVADDRNLYFVGNRAVHRFDLASRKVESRPVALLSSDPATVRIVMGQIYVVQSGAIVRIDPSTFDAELLASAKRRPAQTMLDDRTDLNVTPIEDRGTLALVGKNEIFRWDAARRDFVAEPLALRPHPGKAYDRDFMLKVQPLLPYDLTDPAGDPGYWMILDPGRTGALPAMSGRWPPPLNLEGSESFPSQIHGMSAGGSNLYVLFSGGVGRGLHIMVYGKIGDFCAPLAPISNPRKFTHSRITGSDLGALVWGRGSQELFFYGLKDLEKFPR